MNTNLNSSENLDKTVLISGEQNKSISASKAEPMISLFLEASSILFTSDLIFRTMFHSSFVIASSTEESLHPLNHSSRCIEEELGLCNCQASSAVKLKIGDTHLTKASKTKYRVV